jgi:hypothetical protein
MTSRPTYHLLGGPLRSGSLYPGSEHDAKAHVACLIELLAGALTTAGGARSA